TQPQFAFAAVYEGDVGANVHGGSHAAPMIGKIFKEVYKTTEKRRSRGAPPADDALRAEPVEDDSGDESD
ncbi:MAG: hypothetical protein H0T11_01840, partial [Chthoniobacterales bacterium]|nr:hypothetical protein [Chthoniobacterales bacterium]